MESDIQLLCRCADFTLSHTREAEEAVVKELDNSAATSLVMALRIFRLQRAVLAVGMFSLFESLLQNGLNWRDPFASVPKFLRKHGRSDLSQTFEGYKDAVNVLKHGKGPSYRRLLPRAEKLEFKIKIPDEQLFKEDDVSEVQTLIDVNDLFVRRCAEVIEEVTMLIEAKEDVVL